MIKAYSLSIIFLLAFTSALFAQLNVTPSANGTQLAQIMSGPGVIISNVAMNCPDGAAGSFTCNSCSLNMDSGILLTNGMATNAEGPNNSPNITYAWDTTGTTADTDLANLIGQPITELYDVCTLEFDLTVQSDSIQFNYIFGSEEYPDFVCSNFNDAFAFFISGPGITGEKDIALIPGTTTPVSINSVNPGTPGVDAFGGTCSGANQSLAYSQYYVNNGTGGNAPYSTDPYYIQYNGFTTTLTAGAGGLDACSTYHLKLIIADVSDPTYDSGVFIQANSLSSNLVSLGPSGTSVAGVDSAILGCTDGFFTLQFVKPVSQNTTVHFNIAGTAVNGTDYSLIADSIEFLAGDSTEKVTIHPIGNSTQPQSVIISLQSACGTVYDTSVLYIAPPYVLVTGPDTSVCPGDSVQLFATAGVPAQFYIWQPGTDISNPVAQNPIVFPQTNTTYVCTAHIQGCNYIDSVTVGVYTTPPFSVSAGPDILSCGTGNVQLNATVTGTPVGGAFVYDWAPATGLTSNTISNPVDTSTSSNTYVIFVTSGHCSVSDTISVNIDDITETMSSTLTSCSYSATGTATVNVNTGTSPYSYNWNSGAAGATASGLAPGLYHVTITDHADCTVTDTITVYAPAPIVFGTPTVTPVSCVGGSNGSATASASGGTGNISYAWSSGSSTATATNLSDANYTVTATDANLCTATMVVSISTLPPVADSISTTEVSCFGNSDGTATAVVSGGTSPYTYLWSTMATTVTINGLAVGNYTETVTDNAGCTATATGNIGQPNMLSVSDLPGNVTCFGANNGSIILSITGGTTPYSFEWSDSSHQENLNNLSTGYYMVTVTDIHGCTDTASATITQPTTLVLTDSIVNATCYGSSDGAVYLTVTGGTPPYNYNWGNGITSQNATNIPANNYYPSVTDNAGCVVYTVATVTSPGQIVFDPALVINVSCSGGSNGIVQIYPYGGVGGFTYTWNNQPGNNPDSNIAAGTYHVIVTDTNNCTAAYNVTVTQPTPLLVSIVGDNALCAGGADGKAVDEVTGGTPPYRYVWNNGETTDTAYGLAAGNYQTTVIDNGNCTATSSTVIGAPSPIIFTVDSTPVKCIGTSTGTLTLVVQGGGVPPYTYAATQTPGVFETTTDSVIEGLDTGYYLVQVSDNNGCIVSDSAYVPNAIPDSFSITTDSTSCFGPQYADGGIQVTGLVAQNTPYQYSVDGGPLQYSGNFTGLTAGTHSLHIINFNGCPTDTPAVIGEPIAGITDVYPTDTTIQLGESIQLFSSFSNYPLSSVVSYNWVPSVGLSCINCPAPVVSTYSHINTYTLTITYNNGCTASDSAQLIVTGTPPVYIPNAFTPNGDGIDDIFMIYSESIKTVSLKIFNRWGEKVFDSENQFLGWDGTFKGQQQLPGVYVYEAQITFLDNTQTLRTGSITLIR